MSHSEAGDRTRVKICGITSVKSAEAAVEAGADAIGLVMADDSPRKVDPEAIDAILATLTPFVDIVGIYRDPEPAHVYDDAILLWDWAQMHGQESESLLERVMCPVIRGFPFDPEQVWRWNACDAVDVLLIDGPRPGSGRGFDHNELAKMMPLISKPVILAGGLDPTNVGTAVRTIRPYAVDVSTGVETAPGVKDPTLMAEFCMAVQEADRAVRRDQVRDAS